MVKLLLKHDEIDVNLADRTGRTPLYMAILNNLDEIVKLLLEHGGVDLNKADDSGTVCDKIKTCLIFSIILIFCKQNLIYNGKIDDFRRFSIIYKNLKYVNILRMRFYAARSRSRKKKW